MKIPQRYRRLVVNLLKNKNFQYPLIALAAVDCIFFAFHLLLKFQFLSNQMFDIGLDNSAGEYFQYFKLFSIALLLGVTYRRLKDNVFIPWLFLFLYLLIDDFFSLHETAGEVIAQSLVLPSLLMMDPLDLGEIIFSCAMGVLFLAGVFTASFSAKPQSKEISVILLLLVCTLAFFGISIDSLHSMVDNMNAHLWVSGCLSLVEDGGEQLTISITTAFLISVTSHTFAGNYVQTTQTELN